MTKFMIITKYDTTIIDAQDWEDAFNKAFDNHTHYDYLIAIVRIQET